MAAMLPKRRGILTPGKLCTVLLIYVFWAKLIVAIHSNYYIGTVENDESIAGANFRNNTEYSHPNRIGKFFKDRQFTGNMTGKFTAPLLSKQKHSNDDKWNHRSSNSNIRLSMVKNGTVQIHGSNMDNNKYRNHDNSTNHHVFQLSQAFIKNMELVKIAVDDFTNWLQFEHKHVNRRKRGAFTPPNPTNAARLTLIENTLQKVVQDIEYMKQSPSINFADRSRIAVLETSIHGLQTTYDNQKQEILQNLGEKDKEIQNIVQLLDSFKNQLDDMRNRIEQKEAEEAEWRLKDGIIRDLHSHDFSSAQQKLKLQDEHTFRYVVKLTYNHQAGNFKLILEFAEFITCNDHKCKSRIYDALYDEMESNGHHDIEKLLLFRQSLKRTATNVNYASSVTLLSDTVINKMNEVAIALFTHAFQNYDSMSTIKQFSADIFNDCFHCAQSIYKQVIENTLYSSGDNIRTILDKTYNLKYISEKIIISDAVADKLINNNKLYSNAAIALAEYIKVIMSEPYYWQVPQERKTILNHIKNRLPTSVRNLVLSSTICMRNTRYQEYLYVPHSDYSHYAYDSERRYVFTWVPKNVINNKFRWSVSSCGNDHIYIRNIAFNEYLYAGGYTYDDTRRYAFTWQPGNPVSNGCWKVEVDGDEVYLKNTSEGEYLFADYDTIWGGERRLVFTYRRGTRTEDSKWMLEDC